MARYNPIRIYPGGVRWTGDWSLDGPDIVIRSAYGWARQTLGRRKPERFAEQLLLEILRAKLEAREAT